MFKTDTHMKDAQGRTHARNRVYARTHAPLFSHLARRCTPMCPRSHGVVRGVVAVVVEIIPANAHATLL